MEHFFFLSFSTKDLQKAFLQHFCNIGMTAQAHTPWMQKLRSLFSENLELSKFEPGVGWNVVLHATPTVMSSFIIATFPAHSASFSLVLSKRILMFAMNSNLQLLLLLF